MRRTGKGRVRNPWRARPVTILLACGVALAASGPLQSADGLPDLTFHPNGAVEIAYNYGGNLYDYVQDVAADGSGNLFVVGFLTSETVDYDWGVTRLNAQGGGQSTRLFFDQGGTNNDEANAVVLDATGGVIVAGSVDTASSRDIRICRLLPATLALDSAFGTGGCEAFAVGTGSYFDVTRVARSGDGGFIVGGTIAEIGNPNFFAVKFTSTGAVDFNFGFFGIRVVAWDYQTNGGDYVYDMAVDLNGSVLLAGAAQHPTYGYVFAIAKLTSAGNLDLSFAGGTGKLAFSSTGPYFATAVTVVPVDGTSFVAGAYIDNGNGTSTTQVGMFDASGGQVFFPGTIYHLLDVTWNPVTTNFIRRLVYQSDGKLLIAGDSSGGTTYEVSRLNASGGALDTTFGASGVASYVPASHSLGTGSDVASATLSAGRPVVVGDTLDPDLNWLVVRQTNALIFADGFESGSTRMWSAAH